MPGIEVLIRVAAVVVFSLFLPVTAYTYLRFRKRRNEVEVNRILSLLDVDDDYRSAFQERFDAHFVLSVCYATVIAIAGLTVLFADVALSNLELLPNTELSDGVIFPRQGSYVVMGMAFLGAYLWGVQFVARRYAVSDLVPEVYYGLSVRMVAAPALALIIFNAASALTGGGIDGSVDGGITAMIWPALAFLLGAFPHRGIMWLSSRLPMIGPQTDDAVREAPLEMIEGMTAYDRMRLEELNIDTCYDLANVDFVPLVLRTPYSARELLDWVLQAKLCVLFGPAVKSLREQGIRTLVDLATIEPDGEPMKELAQETAATLPALRRARARLEDGEIQRLLRVGVTLGRYWNEVPLERPAEPSSGAARADATPVEDATLNAPLPTAEQPAQVRRPGHDGAHQEIGVR